MVRGHIKQLTPLSTALYKDLHFQFIFYFNELLTARRWVGHVKLTKRERKYGVRLTNS